MTALRWKNRSSSAIRQKVSRVVVGEVSKGVTEVNYGRDEGGRDREYKGVASLGFSNQDDKIEGAGNRDDEAVKRDEEAGKRQSMRDNLKIRKASGGFQSKSMESDKGGIQSMRGACIDSEDTKKKKKRSVVWFFKAKVWTKVWKVV
ncbi:hypothetical protein QYF36_002160 [Acer negundo]|nr:hypothetical protein QYF36_002160 [Acer negundo]